MCEIRVHPKLNILRTCARGAMQDLFGGGSLSGAGERWEGFGLAWDASLTPPIVKVVPTLLATTKPTVRSNNAYFFALRNTRVKG